MSHQEPRITVDPVNRDTLIIPGPHIAVDPSDPSGNTLVDAGKTQVGESPEHTRLGDLNGDGRVDGADLARSFESQTKPHADGILASTYGRGVIEPAGTEGPNVAEEPNGGGILPYLEQDNVYGTAAQDGTSNTMMASEPAPDDGPSTLLSRSGPGSDRGLTLDGKGTDVNVEEIELLKDGAIDEQNGLVHHDPVGQLHDAQFGHATPDQDLAEFDDIPDL